MNKLKGSLSNAEDIITLSGTLADVSSLQGTLSNFFLRGLSAYQEALLEGFTGTREEWIESLNGEEVLLRENDNNIEWKYSDEDEWKHLISLEATRDYDKLVNKPTLDGASLEGAIDDIINEKIQTQFEKITDDSSFEEEFALTNQELEDLLS